MLCLLEPNFSTIWFLAMRLRTSNDFPAPTLSAIQKASKPIFGLQFHPEFSPNGIQILIIYIFLNVKINIYGSIFFHVIKIK